MFTGQQIKEKRKKEGLTVEQLAERLDVPAQSLYKWQKGTRPNNPEHYTKLENWLKTGLESPPEASETEPKYGDLKDEVIALLKRENARLQKDLAASLGELRHNILLTRALAATNQNLLIELLAKQRKISIDEVVEDTNRQFDEFYKSMKAEGKFADVGS